MNKFITAHRRGTLSQWKRSNIVPKEGELVLAQTTRKTWDTDESGKPRLDESGKPYLKDESYYIVKIGDGEHCWKDLPQVDEDTRKDILGLSFYARNQVDNITKILTDYDKANTVEAEVLAARTSEEGQAFDSLSRRLDDMDDRLETASKLEGASLASNLEYNEETGELNLVDNDGFPLGEPVVIKGGSGGGGSGGGSTSFTKVTVSNLNASNNFSVVKGSSVLLKFRFTSTEDGVPTGDGTCTLTVGSREILTKSIIQGDNEMEVSSYLSEGSNSVKLRCEDQYGNYRNLTYKITVAELRLTSLFDATKIQTAGEEILFTYTPIGVGEKEIHFQVDGVELDVVKTSSTGKQLQKAIPGQKHGVHRLEVYATSVVGEVSIESDHLIYDLICVDKARTDIALMASTFTTTSIEQGNVISIPYQVYDPSAAETKVVRKITYTKDGKEVIYSQDEQVVDRSQQLWNTRSYPEGEVTFSITYNYGYQNSKSVSVSHKVTVKKAEISITPVTEGLEIHLSAQGRANTESNPGVWSSGDVTTTFEDFNWKSNGWLDDENKETCLRLNGDARAIINYQPFKTDLKSNGKTIELEFAVRDINNRDAVVIDCMSGDIGFRVSADTFLFKSQGARVGCNFDEETRTRVSVTVQQVSGTDRLLSIYLDGILSGVQQYSEQDNFQQSNPVSISLGTDKCGLDLYSVRVYKMALTADQIVDNFIADTSNAADKLDRYAANNIYDATSRISYELLKEQIPVVTLIGDLPKYKGDKKVDSVRLKFEDPFHPELNFEDLCSSIDVQGTSSRFYARKNWKVKFKTPHQHMPGELPAKVFCLKVDYAEATGTHNTQAANFIETLYSEKIPPQLEDARHRSTIEGFPIAIFEQEVDDLGNFVGDPIFAAKGNFNYDKGAANIFGFTTDYDTESWEFCNNTTEQCNFKQVINSAEKWTASFEPRYAPPFECADGTVLEEPFDLLEELEEKAADKNLNLTAEEESRLLELREGLIARFKRVHDWVVSTQGDAERFRREFEDHFDLHYCLIYYVFTFFALMVDQRAKNMFLTYWDPNKDGNGKWYPYFYDNDTIFGINNEGELAFDYYHEDTDLVDTAYVFNGAESVLWNQFRSAYASEIKATYADLRQNGNLKYEKLLNRFVTQGSDMWSESVYNEDANYKYISIMNTKNEEDGKNWGASQLYQVRGSGKQHLSYFLRNRFNYCDSKWQTGEYLTSAVQLRLYSPREDVVVAADHSITVTPYSDLYAGVAYGGHDIEQARLSKNEPYKFVPPDSKEQFNDTETYIYGADQLSSLGDLSTLYCGSLDVSAASKLVDLVVGNHTEGYKNDNFYSIALGTNNLLRRVDLTNCSGLGRAAGTASSSYSGTIQETLDVSKCPNIEEIETFGTNLKAVTLPESGYLKRLHLPQTINNLTIKNQVYLEDLVLEGYKNIRTLNIENCPTLDARELLEKCRDEGGNYTVERVRLTGLKWSFEDAKFLLTLTKLKGIDESGQNTDIAVLVGTCKIASLSGEEAAELKKAFPLLEITSTNFEATLRFMNATGVEIQGVRQVIRSYGADGYDPVEEGYIPAPTKAPTKQYTYTFTGWSTFSGEGEEPQSDAVLNITANRILYPTFAATIRSYNVNFYWNVADKSPKYSVSVDYGADAAYEGDTPIKGTTSASAFRFIGWLPAPTEIQGTTNCYAQYEVIEDQVHTYELSELTYSLDATNHALSITGLQDLDSSPTAVRIPKAFVVEEEFYTVTSVGGFAGSPVVYVELPEALAAVENDAFSNCKSLESIRVPESVKSLGKSAFTGCNSLESIFYDAVSAQCVEAGYTTPNPFDSLGTSRGACVTIGSEVTQIPAFLFYQNSQSVRANIRELKFAADSKCTSIGTAAFGNCYLQSLELPNGLLTLNQAAFQVNNAIKDLKLPESITQIGADCFKEWTALQHLTLPTRLRDLGTGFVRGCSNIKSFSLASSNNNFHVINPEGEWVEEGVGIIRASDNYLIAGTGNCVIPDYVRGFAAAAFKNTSIESANIPENVEALPEYLFDNCRSLRSITLPGTLKTMGSNALYYCALPEIQLPESLEYLGTYALAGNKFMSLTIPNSCREVADYCLRRNDTLKTLDFGSGVQTLGYAVVSDCSQLVEATLSENLAVIKGTEAGATIFSNCPNLKVVNVPFEKDKIAGAPWGAPESATLIYNYVRPEEE